MIFAVWIKTSDSAGFAFVEVGAFGLEHGFVVGDVGDPTLRAIAFARPAWVRFG